MVFFSFASPQFLQTDNLVSILQSTAVNGVLAIACTFVIITAGIDLSVGTLMTFCAVMAGVVLTYMGMPLALGIAAAIFFGALSGFVSGVLIAKLKIPPFIATLGMMMLLKGLSLVISGTKRNTPEGALSMPAFGNAYTDDEIAAVANFVTARFGAKGSKLTAQDIAELRKQTAQ